METQPRYTRSRDGARIAYAVHGDGPPLLWLLVPTHSHIELFPRLPSVGEYMARLGKDRQLIRIDLRGTGMSDRGPLDYSPERFIDDVEAVLDATDTRAFAILAGGARVTAALGIAVRRPDAAQRVVLSYPYNVRPPGLHTAGGERSSLRPLMEEDWEQYLEVSTQRKTGRRVSEIGETIAFVRRCIDQRSFLATLDAARPEQDWANATLVHAPALVVEFAGNVHIPAERVRAFAARFPHGTYVALPERAMPPPYGADPELYLQAVNEFLGPALAPHASAENLLTAREREVLRLLVAGKTQREIAEALVISPSTASRHVSNLYEKVGAHRRADVVVWAFRHGMD